MPRLLAEAFAEPLEDAVRVPPAHRYDETRRLSVLADGRVFVEHAVAGETHTETKAAGEQDDRDPSTITKVEGEVDAWCAAYGGTSTAVTPEADDWAATQKGSETVTHVHAEGDDWSALSHLDTQTRIRREADDWAE